MAIKKINEFGFFMRTAFKILTLLQKRALKLSNTNYYYALSKIHFKLYFKKNLLEEMLIGSPEYEAAANRHARMVVKMLYPNIRIKENDWPVYIYEAAYLNFSSTLTLSIKL